MIGAVTTVQEDPTMAPHLQAEAIMVLTEIQIPVETIDIHALTHSRIE